MRLHPDPDLLALHALGGQVLDGPDRDHVAACPGCAATVVELAATVRAVRGQVVHGVSSVPVPAHVWQAISSELGLDPTVRPASVGPTRVPAPAPPDADADEDEDVDVDETSAPRPASTVVDLRTRRRPAPDQSLDQRPRRHRVGLRVLAVAAAGLTVGAVGSALLLSRPTGSGTPATTVLAAAELEAFGAGEGTDVGGWARLAGTGDDDGDRVLQVRLDDLPAMDDEYVEAWLIDPGTGEMVSLGPVDATGAGEGTGALSADLTVPRGLDVGVYAVVDVSAEPRDDDPAHSGVSLVRGTLDT